MEPTDGIVTRLRQAEWNENPKTNVGLCADAADEIERLRAELQSYYDEDEEIRRGRSGE